MWAMLKGFGGGLVGALIGGVVLFWLGFYDTQPVWMSAGTFVGAAVGTAIGSGLTERTNGR